jgi:hypothetical protein
MKKFFILFCFSIILSTTNGQSIPVLEDHVSIPFYGIFKLIKSSPVIEFACLPPSTATCVVIHFPTTSPNISEQPSDMDICNLSGFDLKLNYYNSHAQTWSDLIYATQIQSLEPIIATEIVEDPELNGLMICPIRVFLQ